MTNRLSLSELLQSKEDEHLEFKEAKTNFHFEKLLKYCAALANEGGGSLILGVTDKRPRRIVGSEAFKSVERTKAGLVERLRIRIDAEEIDDPQGRVVVFTAPPRPIGAPISVEGAYWMRAGEDLVPMTPDMLARIFAETGPDFSSEICAGATLGDLDPRAIEEFRLRWHRRSKQDAILRAAPEQLLKDAELVTENGVSYAALILLGSRSALGRHLANAEVIFEYRSDESAGPASQREEFREGFILFYDRLWELVNLRNDLQHYQDGLFMTDIATFNEGAVREAILNAVCHRDYRHAGSVFVREFPRRMETVSPGGFPVGISAENILDRQQPRNRRIADALARCGLVERAGQGANRIYESCIKEGKALPDFTNTDEWQVSLTLHGQVQDVQFVRYLERVARETSSNFNTQEFLVLDLVHREEPIPAVLHSRLRRLIDLGVIEAIGRGRGSRYLLARRFYAMIGQKGTYTRRKGLDDETHKELLLRHLRDNPLGSPLSELHQVLPQLSLRRVQSLLNGMREERSVVLEGKRRWARWRVPKHKDEKTTV